MKPLRARVTYTWGAWWYELRSAPGFAEYICPGRFPTASLAADAARRELARLAEPDPLKRALRKLDLAPVA